MRIVNPETGSVVHEHAEPVDVPSYARPDPETCWVRVPSFRPGLEYDLCTFPRSWMTDEAAQPIKAGDHVRRNIPDASMTATVRSTFTADGELFAQVRWSNGNLGTLEAARLRVIGPRDDELCAALDCEEAPAYLGLCARHANEEFPDERGVEVL